MPLLTIVFYHSPPTTPENNGSPAPVPAHPSPTPPVTAIPHSSHWTGISAAPRRPHRCRDEPVLRADSRLRWVGNPLASPVCSVQVVPPTTGHIRKRSTDGDDGCPCPQTPFAQACPYCPGPPLPVVHRPASPPVARTPGAHRTPYECSNPSVQCVCGPVSSHPIGSTVCPHRDVPANRNSSGAR